MLVKYLLVGYLYGIPSERQIEQRGRTDNALQWYLGLDLLAPVSDHSTISQLRRRKPSFRKVFRRLFEEMVWQCIAKGLAGGRLVGTDATHVKADASRASEELLELPEGPRAYWERLDTYDSPLIHRELKRLGISFYVWPQPAADRPQADFKRDAFIYEEERNLSLYSNRKKLRIKGLHRSASGLYWECRADKQDG